MNLLRPIRALGALLLATMLAACGGGGGEDATAPEPVFTGRALDVVIDGEGTLVLAGPDGQISHARGARLVVLPDGGLATSDGRRPIGWPLVPGMIAGEPAPLSATSAWRGPILTDLQLQRAAPISQGTFEPGDRTTWADIRELDVSDADGRRIWLALVFRKLEDTRWTLQVRPYNQGTPPSDVAGPVELRFDDDGVLLAPAAPLQFDVPAGVDGRGRPTLPVRGVVFNPGQVRLVGHPGTNMSFRIGGWGTVDTTISRTTLRAIDDTVGFEITQLGELRAVYAPGGYTTLRSEPVARLAIATAGAPGTAGLSGRGTFRSGWLPAGMPTR